MFNNFKSTWIVICIFIQKVLDNLHRLVFGLPTLKRSQITANLFLGSQYNKVGIKKLKKLGITAIVNLRTHSVYTSAHFMGIKYLHLPVVDNTPPPLAILLEGSSFIEKEINSGGKVYIHCRQGLGRGPTMTLAYLIKIGVTYNDAFAMVKQVRPFVNPRPGQVEQLKEFETYCSLLIS